jgi:DNA-binding NarL/FixJ family response regulator
VGNPPNAVTRLIVVEDEPLFRELLGSALANRANLDLVGSFGDPHATLHAADALHPDVALLDIELGDATDGVELGLRLRDRLPSIGIVLLSSHVEPRYVSALPPAVASGWSYLLKQSLANVATLERAILGAAHGLVSVDPEVVARLRPRTESRLTSLAPRQRELLELLAAGLTNAAIAERMVLSPKAVENAITRLYVELGIDREDRSIQPRVQAVLLYLRESRLT